jgi:hypothetical protein
MPWNTIDLVALSSRNHEKTYEFIYVDVDYYGQGSFKRISKKYIIGIKTSLVLMVIVY